MGYALVRFSDGVYHVASKKEIKNKVGTQASVYWKEHRSFYLAEILKESQNRGKLINLKIKHERSEPKVKAVNDGIETKIIAPDFMHGESNYTELRVEQVEESNKCENLTEHELTQDLDKDGFKTLKPVGKLRLTEEINIPAMSTSASNTNKIVCDELESNIPYEKLELERCNRKLKNVTTKKRTTEFESENMGYALVRFSDGIYHVASKTEIKNKVGTQASVYWKEHRSFYLAEILKESKNKLKLMNLKIKYERSVPIDKIDAVKHSKEAKILAAGFMHDKSKYTELRVEQVEESNKCENLGERQLTQDLDTDGDKTLKPLVGELFSTEKINIPEMSNLSNSASNTNKIIWDELESNIPYDDILEFERVNGELNNVTIKENTAELATENFELNNVTTQKKTTNCKINIISVKNVYPESNNSRVYKSKQQFCLFCNKLVNRFGRHLTSVHKQEKQVQTIICHEKKTTQRKKLIDQLRTRGNYIYNHGSTNSGQNIVARRPVNKQCPNEYMDCPSCLVRISKVSLRRHVRKCNPIITGARTTQRDSKRVTFDLHRIADPILKEQVFPNLKNDLCTQILRKDYLAILYGNKLVAKYSSSHHHKMIRANLRYIGKYLIEMRQLSTDITDFKSCFSPLYYDSSVKAIRRVAGYDEEKGEYRAPYSASAIGTILKFCCAILESDYIKTQNTVKIPEVQNFLKLLRTELITDINKTVIENLTAIRRSKKVVLPTSCDMATLIKYLRSERDKLYKKMNNQFSFEAWKKMSSYTLVGIMVYNGRRPGEIQRLKISDFMESSQSVDDNPDLFTENSASDIIFTRCVLRGKLGRNVSIVLNNEEVTCIKCIIKYRGLAGVSSSNPYVFGLPSKKPFKFLNAGNLLKRFAKDAGVQHPERLYATNIRKNLATKTTKLSLNLDEKEHVMNFMGHSENIHKTIYRQPDMAKDISIMPKVLDFATGSESTPLKDITCNVISNSFQQNKQHTILEQNITLEGCSLSSFGESDKSCKISNESDDSEYDPEEDISNSEEMQPKRKKRLIDMSLGYVPRRSWTTEEREAAKKWFKDNIASGKSPTSETCKNIIRKCDALSSRTTFQVKAWVSNQIKKKIQVKHGKGLTRRSWSTPEKQICRQVFGEDVQRGVYPNRKKIEETIKKYPQLQERSPEMIVAHLQHAIKKNK